MPTSPVTTKSFVSAYVNAYSPKKNTSTSSRIGLRTGGGNGAVYGLLFCSLPAPLKAKYTSATLELYAATAIPAGRTITVQRVTTKWAAGSVTWNNRPSSTTGNQATFITSSTIPVGGKLSFNVMNLLQDASNGQAFYGFLIQISGDPTTARYLYSQRGPAAKRPVLSTTWSDAPLTPTALSPSGGRAVSLSKPVLECNHIDVSGNTDLVAMQVMIDDSSGFPSPWTSLEEPVTSPQLDLSTTTFPGISAGETLYWKVRLKDGAGLWSGWSAAASFTYVGKGSLALSSPTGPIVSDPTQTVIWTLTGATQRSRQVLVTATDTGKLLWDSGKLTTTDNDYTLPGSGSYGLLGFRFQQQYTVYVRVWDTIDRAATTGDTPYLEVSSSFQYALGTDDPFVGTTATLDSEGRPWVEISATRANAPDFIAIYRDGNIVGKYEPEDLLVSGTTYAFVDRFSSPRRSHTWNMVAITTGGSSSSKGPDAVLTPKPSTAWLCSEDGQYSIPLTNYTNGMSLQEDSSTFTVLGSTESVDIYTALRGWEGPFSGVMTRAIGSRDSAQYLNEFLKIRDIEGLPLILSWADHSVRVVIKDATYSPVVYTEEIVYAASFTASERNRPAV